MRRGVVGMAVATVAASLTVLAATMAVAVAPAQAPGSNWPTFLYGPAHSSYNKQADAITPANAGSLSSPWTWMPGAPPLADLGYSLVSSPTVVNGVIYIGANNGTFYAINEATGQVEWQKFFGYVTGTTCNSHGFASTAAVALDPVDNQMVVYLTTATGYLYALNPSTGAQLWRSVIDIPSTTENNYFDWSSPTVANGHIYLGVSSQCDRPLVPAGVLAFDQHTGKQLASWASLPPGQDGASVWSSVAVDSSGTVFASTGNGPATDPLMGSSESIVALNGTTLQEIGSWQVTAKQAPGIDSDFGSSPTIFSATLPGSSAPVEMVGACNKSGLYFALQAADLAAGPVWSLRVGAPSSKTVEGCDGSAVYDGQHLFIAGPPTTIGGVTYNGSIREVAPATGKVLWATGLPGAVVGTPTLDGAGVLSVASFDISGATNNDYLVDAANGALLATIDTNSLEFAQPVFAGDYLLLATFTDGLLAYVPPSSGSE